MSRATPLLVLLVVAAAVPRWKLSGQTLYGDELSTLWVTSKSLGGMFDELQRFEITPPLSFVAEWVVTRADDGARALRATALVASLATIPLVYALALRLAGRTAGLVAAALVAASPFAIAYAAEARAYALLAALVTVAALAALLALDTGRRGWWWLYGAATAATAYTHYTGVFVLLALYGWIVVGHPAARRPATLACLGAAVAFAPWGLTGFLDDLRAPDAKIVEALVDFSPGGIAASFGHWAIGHPRDAIPLTAVPGTVALVLLLGGLALALPAHRGRVTSRAALVALLAVAAPAGSLLASVVGPEQLTSTSMTSSLPFLAVGVAWLLVTAAPRVRAVATGAVLAGMLLAAVAAAGDDGSRPDYRAVGDLVRPGDVVLDGSGAFFGTPGPLTPVDALLGGVVPTFRFDVPDRRDTRFGFGDVPVELSQAVAAATRDAGDRIVVAMLAPVLGQPLTDPEPRLRAAGLPAAYRLERRVTRRSRIGATDVLLFHRAGR